jgi:hypothetical protein
VTVVECGDAIAKEQWDTGTRVYRRWEYGVLHVERPFTDAETAAANSCLVDATRLSNQAALLAKARTAFTNNAAYLAKVTGGTATTADHIAQVPALTRQMQGLIRLIVGSDLLDAADDSTQTSGG